MMVATRRTTLKLAGVLAAMASSRTAGASVGRAESIEIESLDGRLIRPADPDYERQRQIGSTNARFDRRPVAIVECASVSDVRRALEAARLTGLEIAVRAGGHDVLGASTTNGLVVDLRGLTSIQWGPQSVRVGAGVRAGELDAATAARARVVPLGCNPAVGVSGLTLGGGLGWFVGLHGATCDNVRQATVVTVDGDVLEASESGNPDLYWALRGGGGNFGVVTEWEYRTRQISDVVGGALVYRGDSTREFLAFYRDYLATAPDSLTVEVVGLAHVEPVIVAVVVFAGDIGDAEKVLRPLRRFGPIADGLKQGSFQDFNVVDRKVQAYFEWTEPAVSNEPRAPGSYWQGTTVEALSDEAIEKIAEAIADPPPGWSFGLGHVMRGRVLEPGESQTPFIRRKGNTSVHFDGGWSYASHGTRLMEWIDSSIAELAPYAARHEYVNYLSKSGDRAVASAYGHNYRRLQDIKRRYDPGNLLRLNRNVRPA